MNWRQIPKAVRCLVACAVVFLGSASAIAAPLITVSIQGRHLGTIAWQYAIPDANPGDILQYRVLVDIAPIGTSNTQRNSAGENPVTTTIFRLTEMVDGVNSLPIRIEQSATDAIQVDFTAGSTEAEQHQILLGQWGDAPWSSGGVRQNREGTPFSNLVDIWPARAEGSFFGVDPRAMISPPSNGPRVSEFTIMSTDYSRFPLALIWPVWDGRAGRIGIARVNANDANSPAFLITDETENSGDPIVRGQPLVLGGIPEPPAILLVVAGMLCLRRFGNLRTNPMGSEPKIGDLLP